MAALYTFVFRAHFAPGPRPNWPLRIAPMAAAVVIPLALSYGAGWEAFPAASAGSLIALAIIVVVRPDLIRVALVSAVAGTILALPAYVLMEVAFPGVVEIRLVLLGDDAAEILLPTHVVGTVHLLGESASPVPIIESRVTSFANSSSRMPSVPAGRCGSTR